MRVIDRVIGALDAASVVAVCVLLCPDNAADLLLALAVHELAHVLAIRMLGGRIVSLAPAGFGFRLRYTGSLLSRRARFTAAIAGAAANFLIAFTSAMFGALRLAAVNIVLAVFNLLPIDGLDGGEALASILSVDGTGYTAGKICSVVSVVTAAVLWMVSVYIQLRVAPMPETVIAASVLLIRELISK